MDKDSFTVNQEAMIQALWQEVFIPRLKRLARIAFWLGMLIGWVTGATAMMVLS